MQVTRLPGGWGAYAVVGKDGRMAPSLRSQVVEGLGGDICSGRLAVGTVLSVEDVMARFEVSRSVVREALSVLASLGLVVSQKRVGTTVQPPEAWRAFDPSVIRWRLAGADPRAEFRTLTELRSAVEPYAAELAAERATTEQAGRLLELAARLEAAGRTGDQSAFEAADVEFHRLVLQSSGNPMLQELADVVAEVLASRHRYGIVPRFPDPTALDLHQTVATAIRSGEREIAGRAARRIVERSADETAALFRA